MNISQKMIYRYESQIDNGKLLIFDIEEYKVYSGTVVEYLILRCISNGKTLNEIVNEINYLYKINETEKKVKNFVSFLLQKGLIIGGTCGN